MAISLTRQSYEEGLEKIGKAAMNDKSYLDSFSFDFPEGLNTANALEICRAMQDDSMELRIRLTKIVIAGKTVEVTCPNGDKEKFCLSNASDSFDGFDVFQKDPLVLLALSDTIFGFILKKSLRLPIEKKTAQEAAQ